MALTSVTGKCLEKLVLLLISPCVPDVEDLQFANRLNTSVDDTVALTRHSIIQHLDSPNTYTRLLFQDLSSAFNTTGPMKLIIKFTDLGVRTPTCDWILEFLTSRPQVERLESRSLLRCW